MEKEEYLEILEKTSNDQVDKIMELLAVVLRIYKSKRGTYRNSYWKAINERKIESSIDCINGIMEYYFRFDSLTPAQIVLAKKMISNGFKLM